ncbi:MAG: efflux RND transporter periplasmic adaptor subunit, partial [Burkholderiaceae bacterium]
MRSRAFLKPAALAAAVAAALVLAACGKAPAATGNRPAPEVGVVVVQSQSLALTTELAGRTAPFLVAEVRPQVNGILQQRLFREGADVKAGTPLYQIDSAIYQALVDSAAATLAKAEANLGVAKLSAVRHAELVKIDAVSQQANDDAQARLKQAEAEVAAARAALDTARINLQYTAMSSPISGRIGRSMVTPGALLTANQTVALATVQQIDPIYVDVTQSSTDLLRLKRELAAGKLKSAGANQASVKLLLEDGSTYSAPGKLQFSDVTVDPGTGSVTLRAVFPNSKGELLPGMYVRAVLEEGVREQAILVPQQALSRDPKGNATVFVLDGEDVVAVRPVKTTRTVGDKWLVTEG